MQFNSSSHNMAKSVTALQALLSNTIS